MLLPSCRPVRPDARARDYPWGRAAKRGPGLPALGASPLRFPPASPRSPTGPSNALSPVSAASMGVRWMIGVTEIDKGSAYGDTDSRQKQHD